MSSIKINIQLPFSGVATDNCCRGVKFAGGLFLQCNKTGVELCKGCVSAPTIEQRLRADFKDEKGRAPTHYSKIMKKNGWTSEMVLEFAAKAGVTINEADLVAPEEDSKRVARKPKCVPEVETSMSPIVNMEDEGVGPEIVIDELKEDDSEKVADASDAEKEAKKAEKEAEKEAAKAAKELAQQEKKVEKKPTVKAPVPAAAVKKAAVATEVVTPFKKKSEAVKKPVAAKVEEIPSDGMVHPWAYKSKKYLRNADGETWTVGADGGVGVWAGLYDAKTDKLDTSASEPVFDDEE